MSDTYDEGPDPIRPLSEEEQKLIVSSMFTATAIMAKDAADLCADPECHDDHEGLSITIPFLELEAYYEEGGKSHAYIPVQLLPGMIEAASRVLGAMFPGWGSLSGETMQMPDTIEGWPGQDNNNEETP